MKSSILISIKPEWVAKILNGKKTIEIRKTAPKRDSPFDVYIYCTKGGEKLVLHRCGGNWEYVAKNKTLGYEYNGKVVAKFTCWIGEIDFTNPKLDDGSADYILKDCCLTLEQAREYQGNKPKVKLWHISDLVIFDKPKKLWEFEKPGSYDNPTIKCKKKEQGICNRGKSPFTRKWVGCEKARLTKSPQSWCYVEAEE